MHMSKLSAIRLLLVGVGSFNVGVFTRHLLKCPFPKIP